METAHDNIAGQPAPKQRIDDLPTIVADLIAAFDARGFAAEVMIRIVFPGGNGEISMHGRSAALIAGGG
jgi:hypothetical protein